MPDLPAKDAASAVACDRCPPHEPLPKTDAGLWTCDSCGRVWQWCMEKAGDVRRSSLG